MENNNYLKNIARKIREISKDYEKQGYTVLINPKQSQLPDFLKGYEPDIIAKRDDESVLIEVKTRKDRPNLERFENLAKEIDKRENWRFEMIFTNPVENNSLLENKNTITETAVNNRIAEIKKLIDINSFEAAFLLSWSTIEAVLRQKLAKEKSDSFLKPSISIIRTMFSLGLLNQKDYKLLQEVNNYRNSLIHGFQQSIDRNTIQEVLQLINNIAGKNRDIELLDWLDEVDLGNYEEIYCLYRAALDNEDYGLFEVSKENGKIVLKANHMDETLEFDSEEELKKFADLIEEEYMEDMDAEGWYSFQRAMEKDD